MPDDRSLSLVSESFYDILSFYISFALLHDRTSFAIVLSREQSSSISLQLTTVPAALHIRYLLARHRLKEHFVMRKKWLLFMAMLAILSLGVAACSIKDSSQAAANAVEVDMGGANFIQSSVTLKQGQQINLVDKASSTHIIVNGSWVNGKQVPRQEPGAPTINMTFTGNDSALTPPWNTPGTYHLYCTIHVGMNLTVIVQ